MAITTPELEERAEQALRSAYGLPPPPLLVRLHAAAARALVALVAEAGGGERIAGSWRYARDCLVQDALFGGRLHLTVDLLALAFPEGERSAPPTGADEGDEEPLPPDDEPLWVDFPELFAFASPQIDGVVYGLVVHAPERPADDYPVAEWDPRGGTDRVDGLGPDVASGLGRLLSRQLAMVRQGAPVPPLPDPIVDPDGLPPGGHPGPCRVPSDRLAALARSLGLTLDPDAPPTIAEQRPPFEPLVPPGWRFEPSRDGIGVLAPAAAFGVEPVEPAHMELPDLIEAAEQALDRGHPASALWLLREALVDVRHEPDAVASLLEPLQRAYHALGRPLLAERAGRMGA